MHVVWSTRGNPTLHISRTPGSEFCRCNVSYNNDSYPDPGTFKFPGLDSDFSLTIVFTRLIAYDAMEGLNTSIVCDDEAFNVHSKSYSSVALGNMSWKFIPEAATFVGSKYIVNGTTSTFQIRVSNC